MPDAVSAKYVSDLNVLDKHLRLTVTATGDDDVVATVYDMDSLTCPPSSSPGEDSVDLTLLGFGELRKFAKR